MNTGRSIASDHSMPLSCTLCTHTSKTNVVLINCWVQKIQFIWQFTTMWGNKKAKIMRMHILMLTEHDRLSAGYCKQSGKFQITGPGSLLLCCFGTQATNPSPQLSSGIWSDESRWAGSASESWSRQQSVTDGGGGGNRPATGRHRSNAPNVSIKTAVSATAAAMINYWQAPSLLSPSHLLRLPFPSSPKIRQRLRHESRRPVFRYVTSVCVFFS